MKRINWKRVLILTCWAVSLVGVSVLLSFVSNKQDKIVCKGVKIVIEGKNFLVEKGDILALMNRVLPQFVSHPLDEIPVEQIERAVKLNPYVERADIFIDLDGIVRVNVKQREPVVRIINKSFQSFYVDKNGRKMPLSLNFSPRVVVANGNIDEQPAMNDTLKTKLAKDIFALAQFIGADENEFWKAQIVQVFANSNAELELIPRVGNHRILLGDTENLSERMNNLIVFYKKALPRVGWERYKVINIKYQNQVIGVRDTLAKQYITSTDTLKTDSTRIN
ncbi:cell division protein FtsQ/DivIB [Solitalea lacus]|uniref:cell division protein FtsQ/DivIB n=1 Tax=Solitalea lacus TaxID=2911172 RepID=UPI001EDC02D7|nr:cell division protein FtsQ [Solitalea lacus]UKJ06846.1 cell division protein FtsQ [Solitalea lacus]